jgi:hypothetical protein
MQKQKGISTLAVIIIIIVIAIIVIGGVFTYQYFSEKTAQNTKPNTPAPYISSIYIPAGQIYNVFNVTGKGFLGSSIYIDGILDTEMGPNYTITNDTSFLLDATFLNNGSHNIYVKNPITGQSNTSKFQVGASIQNQTAGWKTYTNPQYGFQMQYPNNWMILKESTDLGEFSVSFKTEADVKYAEKIKSQEVGGPTIALFVFDNSGKLSLPDWASQRDVLYHTRENPIKNITQIKINGIDVIKYEGTEYEMGGNEPIGTVFHTLFSENNKIIDINYQSTDKISDIFNQMISTFKFTK